MGFIQQSDKKKIYAYLTQYARQQILDGNEADITVKYFSLHDNDVNYNISANIVNNSYNTLPSGFIPDITGDNQGCLFSIANGINLGVIPEPPIVQPPIILIATVVGSCVIDSSTDVPTGMFEITVTDVQGGSNQGFTWYVVTEIISFPNSNSTISDAITVSSTTSSTYNIGETIPFNATFKFSDNGYLPRSADSRNFIVYATDSLGNTNIIQEFKDENCSIRQFGAVQYTIEPLSADYPNGLNLITQNQLDNLPNISRNKIGFALFVVDNGNRRRDLNIRIGDFEPDGITSFDVGVNFNDDFRLSNMSFNPSSISPGFENLIKSVYRIPFYTVNNGVYNKFIQDSDGYHSQSQIIDGAIVNTVTQGSSAWADHNYNTLVPTTIHDNPQYIPYRGNYDALHPTVIPFNDTVLNGFQISYVEVALKYDGSPQLNSARYVFGIDGTKTFIANLSANYPPPEIIGSPVVIDSFSDDISFQF